MTITDLLNKPYLGDWFEFAKLLPDNSVHLCITSPPYWRARKYEVTESVFGGDPECDHEWGSMSRSAAYGRHDEATLGYHAGAVGDDAGRFCVKKKCGAWLGELGLEATPQHYVHNIADAFEPVRRVIRPDATFLLDIGDKFADKDYDGGIKKGDLVGIPWMVAFELRRRGWHFNQDNVWYKPNPMTEPVTKRCANSHEFVFQFSKGNRAQYWVHMKGDRDGKRIKPFPEYYWRDNLTDLEVDESEVSKNEYINERGEVMDFPLHALHVPPTDMSKRYSRLNRWSSHSHYFDWYAITEKSGRRKHDVWIIPTKGSSLAHFAPFPDTLPSIAIKAGSSHFGCCSKCGAPYHRIIEFDEEDRLWQLKSGSNYNGKYKGQAQKDYASARAQPASNTKRRILRSMRKRKTLAWVATCECEAPISPSIVLDPFGGSFTTAKVAKSLGRDWLSCDLSDKYIELGDKRMHEKLAEGQTRLEKGILW